MLKSRSGRKARFTVYLIKNKVSDADAIVKQPRTQHDVRVAGKHIGTLYLRGSVPVPPSWLRLFESTVDGLPQLRNQHTAGVLLMNAKNRMLAVVFGYGWTLLRPEAIEDKFGLRVALNSIDPERIKSVDRTRLDALTSHMRSQSSRSGNQEQYGIRPEQDLLRAIVGMPRDKDLGSPIAGADSLQLHVAADIAKLPDYLGKALQRHKDTSYREHFEWIDYVSLVRDPTVVAQLEGKLTAALAKQDFSKLYLAIPEIIDWHETSGFRYSDGGATYDDIHFDTFLGTARDSAHITPDSLRTKYIRQIGRASDAVIDKWSVYQCTHYETALNNGTYVLIGGQWYAVDRDFVKRTNKQVGRIALSDISLPAYNDADEGTYNIRAAAASRGNLVCLDDRKLSYGGGHSKVEFCDLYSRAREMIHVKRYTGSPTLSHLFSQAVVPASTLLRDSDFRAKLNAELLPSTHKIARVQTRPDPARFTVVYAIVSHSADDLRTTIPFFSKISLLAAVERLQEAGFRVQLAKIENLRPKEVQPRKPRRRKSDMAEQ